MWIKESNRTKHFKYAILPGMFLTIIFAAGLAIGMELKDKMNGGKFDWLDITATMLGGLIGQIIQIIVIYLIMGIW